MLTPQSSHELKQQAAAFQAKAEKHARWATILSIADEIDLAGEHFARAESESHTASMLYRAAHVLEHMNV